MTINNILDDDFRRLIDYYIECIEKESMKSLEFNFKSEGIRFFSNLIIKEELFHHKTDEILIKDNKVFGEEIKDCGSVFYGYPLYVDPSGSISPIFFVELLPKEKNKQLILTKISTDPVFNSNILRKHGYDVEEIEKIMEDLDEESGIESKIRKISDLLNIKVDLGTVLSDEKLNPFNEPTVLNKSVIYFGENTGFSGQLVKELSRIKNSISFRDLSLTSLGFILNPKLISEYENGRHKPVIEVLEMNVSQEDALASSIQSPVTVITGPPGTGKSQVVANVIANAVWNDQSVIFASKNNRAVDVVIEKLGSLMDKSYIVRMGSKTHRRNAALELDKLLSNKPKTKSAKNLDEKIHELSKANNSIKELYDDKDYIIKKMKQLNEEIDVCQGKLDSILETIPQGLYTLYQYLFSLDVAS